MKSNSRSETEKCSTSDPELNAIIVPVLKTDLEMIEATQVYFTETCLPFASSIQSRIVELIYVVTSSDSKEFRNQFNQILERTGVDRIFNSVELRFAKLDPRYDYYERDRSGMPPTRNGFTPGPNDMFFHIAEKVGPAYSQSFLMELDCVPVAQDWAESIFREAERHPDAWVLGSQYHGWSWLEDSIKEHLNGNAVYRFNNPDFQKFLKTVWKPRLKESVKWGYPGMAYDCLPATIEWLARGPLVPPYFRREAMEMKGRFVEFPPIINLGGSTDKADLFEGFDSWSEHLPDTAIVHAGWLATKTFTQSTAKKKKTVAGRASENRTSEVDFCIKRIWFSERAWVFGNQFSLQEESPKIVLHIQFNRSIRGNFLIFTNSNSEIKIVARRWNEDITRAPGILLGIAGVLQALFRKVPLRKKIRNWIREVFSMTGNWNLISFRSWLFTFRGKKIGSGINEMSLPIKKIGKHDGIVLILESPAGKTTRGSFDLLVEKERQE